MARQFSHAAYGALGVLGLCLLAELVVRLHFVQAASLPAPSRIFLRTASLLGESDIQESLLHTILAWGLTLLAASICGVGLGLAIGLSSLLRDAALFLVDFLRPIPSVGLLPAAILLFGLGLEMKIHLAAYAAFWPILLNTMYGVADVERGLRQSAIALHWGRWRTAAYVVLPGAAPYIATGIRLGSSVALIVVLTAELLAAKNGFGHVLAIYQEAGDPELVYAGIVMAGVLGLCANSGLGWLERRLLHWPQMSDA